MIYIGDFGVSLSSFGALYEFLCILQIFYFGEQPQILCVFCIFVHLPDH